MSRFIPLVIFVAILVSITLPSVWADEANTTQVDILGRVLTNPKAYLAIFIQFILGVALGYFSLKVLKYIIALVLIIVLGMLLSVWSISGDIYDMLTSLYGSSIQAIHLLESLASMLGLLTLGPITTGFIIGAILAWIKS